MGYIENPKTKGSGIKCCIPQKGKCVVKCPDCFFQSGRSYLEPLDEKTPNMPSQEEADGYIIRVNDGNDSAHRRKLVMAGVQRFPDRFYNTSMMHSIWDFDAPVVATVNPGKITDLAFTTIPGDGVPKNLMFVRVRTSMMNLETVVDDAVKHYTAIGVPVVLTFMAYYTESIPHGYKWAYEFRKRTLNSYWVIKQDAWDLVKARYNDISLVYTCGKDAKTHACSRCGHCLREYFATKERMLHSDCPK